MREDPDVVESWGVVDPAHRGLGIGSSLLSRIEERAPQLLTECLSHRFRHAINAGDHAAAAMLRARGLRPVRHFWHMSIELPGAFDRGASPDGMAITRMRSPDGRPVGALTATAMGDRGWVDCLGVLASSRGRGIGAVLLRHSFADFAARGVRRVVLVVDAESPTRATALYERVGMSVVKRWNLWERAGPRV